MSLKSEFSVYRPYVFMPDQLVGIAVVSQATGESTFSLIFFRRLLRSVVFLDICLTVFVNKQG